MSDPTILSSDPFDQITEYVQVEGDKMILTQRQEIEPLMEHNLLQRNNFDERATFKGDGMHKVASIPMVVYMELEAKGITRDQKAFNRWLNDPDNRMYRTRGGRV